ncbi:serine hydrolase domain-containing protein [Flavobacterium cerinum]|uniref:Class A beta-lactamase-related serine hydrolase n=1 Tax=Flavobacterium cerinum TaxID=2502784 RepID=A0A3S3SGB2_9FLAO|nr:serine hydrolase domain-containing protein [Flavobacterium cerinum]RWX02421.1 class A beta-lactamase-related serine hydrolase [Flavobacterium cerinum]
MKKLFAGMLLFLAASLHSQNNFWPVDSLLVQYNKPETAGVSVLVVKDGKVVYNKQAGYANIEKKQPVTPQTVFCLASVSKQFTASCIVLLEQKHKLSFKDQLSKYFPEYSKKNITILDLLNHTSGIKNHEVISLIKGKEKLNYTNKEIRELLAPQELDFEPGTAFSYSNSGYWYLVRIVEKVSGESIVDFAQKNIFKPLKMKNTNYSYSFNSVKNAATGYKKENGINVICPVNSGEGSIAGGGVYGTAEDLNLWLTEMDNKKVLGEAFWNTILNQDAYEFDKENKSFYTKGLFITNYGGKKCISHGGDVEGFHNDLTYLPEAKMHVIILSNNDETKKALLFQAAANLSLGFGFKMPKAAMPAPTVKLSKDVLEKYVGIYEFEPGVAYKVTANDGFLNFTQLWDGVYLSVNASNSNTFPLDPDVVFTFNDEKNGKTQMLHLNQEGQEADFKRVDSAVMADFTSYTGRFRSELLNVEYDFFIKDGLLYYTIDKGIAQTTEIVDENLISIKEGKITYQRNADGVANEFILNHPRAKNFKFERIN